MVAVTRGLGDGKRSRCQNRHGAMIWGRLHSASGGVAALNHRLMAVMPSAYCDRQCWWAGSDLNRSSRRFAKSNHELRTHTLSLSILCDLRDLLFKSPRSFTHFCSSRGQYLLANSNADRIYFKRCYGVQYKPREPSVGPQPRWLPLFQWSISPRGDGQRKRSRSQSKQSTNT